MGLGFKSLVFSSSGKKSGVRNSFFGTLFSLPLLVALYILLGDYPLAQFAVLFLVCVSFITSVILLLILTRKDENRET